MNTPLNHHLLRRRTTPLILGVAATIAVAATSTTTEAAKAAATDPCSRSGARVSCTYTTVGENTFSVPAGVTKIAVTATGGAGGSANAEANLIAHYDGGAGALVSGSLAVTPSRTLYVEVGGSASGSCSLGYPYGVRVQCTPGFNGGGNSGGEAGAGGGASDVRTAPRAATNSAATRLLVAAGGGGAGIKITRGSTIFDDDRIDGGPGGNAGQNAGGGAGSAKAPGAGGPGATSGSGATGGAGAGGGGGGGGGGLFGGGGGGQQAGGGGGSSRGRDVGVAPAGAPPSVTISYVPPVVSLQNTALAAADPTDPSARCLGVDPKENPQGAKAHLVKCSDTTYLHAWDVTEHYIAADGHQAYTFKIRRSDGVAPGCLDVAGESLANGADVVIGRCTGHDSQLWYVGSFGGLGNQHSHMTMDTADAAQTLTTPIVQGWYRLPDNDPSNVSQQWAPELAS